MQRIGKGTLKPVMHLMIGDSGEMKLMSPYHIGSIQDRLLFIEYSFNLRQAELADAT